jgi:CRISPR/Cas system-associated endonuclease Cas1
MNTAANTIELDYQRKALYLLSPNPQSIHSDDDRLIISAAANAPRPIPLRRIQRIVSGPTAQWRGQAIAACLTRDIPIIWLDHRHHPIGDAHPLHREGGLLHHAIQRYLDLPDWRTRYQDWLKSRRMDTLNHLRQQRIHSSADFERYKREYVYQNRSTNPPQPLIRATCQSIVNQHLAEHHARTRYWGYEGQPLEIASDLTELIAVEYHLHPIPKTHHQGEQLKHFETWWKDQHPRLIHHMNELRKHIQSEAETWL